MLLQQIISQSNYNQYIEPDGIDWGGSTTGGYPTLTGVSFVDLFTPTTTNVNTYNHHPFVIKFNNKLHFLFSTTNADEESPGMYVRYTTTDLNLSNQSSVVELFEPQDDLTKARNLGGRVCVPSGFVVYNDELYALTDVNDRLAGADPRPREKVGVLARKINSNGTFDTVYWIENEDGTDSAPSNISGYPVYTFNSTLRTNLREYFTNNPAARPDWYYSVPSTDFMYTNIDSYDGGWLTEPNLTELPQGGYMKLWRPVNTSNDKIKRAQFSEFGNEWGDVVETSVPDMPSRTSTHLVSTNRVVYIGNNDATIRNPLFFAISETGLTVESDDIYNLDTQTVGQQFSGHGKGTGVQYPHSIPISYNQVVCVYSVNKEGIRAALFTVPDLN